MTHGTRKLTGKCGRVALPLGWVAAAALAAAPGAVLAGDGYSEAAADSGTAEFLRQVWMPASSEATAATPTGAEPRSDSRAAADSGTSEFLAQVWMPSSSAATSTRPDAQPGAASGEPDEATTEDTATSAHQEWVESIWNSP